MRSTPEKQKHLHAVLDRRLAIEAIKARMQPIRPFNPAAKEEQEKTLWEMLGIKET